MSATVIAGVVRDYAWGRVDAMQPWTGHASGGPEAELWFGTHEAAPSPVIAAFGGTAPVEAPLLVKLLAAAKPLSIQVHPQRDAIEWMRANDCAHLLVDDHLKAELLIAVERFEILVGLRNRSSAEPVITALGETFRAALDSMDIGDVRGAIRYLLECEQQPQIDAALGVLPEDERAVMERVVAAFPGDRGIPVAFLMQPWILEPGDAAFVDVGTIHAYVHGFGLEVMTSCDNVLRLGLTPKPLAVDAALRSLAVDSRPEILRGPRDSYAASASPFTVDRFECPHSIAPHSTVIASEGSIHLSGPDVEWTMAHGQAAIIESDGWTARPERSAFVATSRRSL